MINLLKSKLIQLDRIEQKLKVNDLKSPKINLGQIQAELNRNKQISRLSDVEFQVFSQWGDDGIIQYLTQRIDMPKTFVEFGVENYTESNTRFLLVNNKWSGLIIDGSADHVNYIKNDPISAMYKLEAVNAFITSENINELLKQMAGELGILSIDVDGNDYWIWEAVTMVNPVIIIVEYNSAFGENTWSIPYKADFVRTEPWIYWGASVAAFNHLAEQRGYSFIGCNGNGNNAYFVRNDKMAGLNKLTVKEGFVDASWREWVVDGKRVSGADRLKLISGSEVIDVTTGQRMAI